MKHGYVGEAKVPIPDTYQVRVCVDVAKKIFKPKKNWVRLYLKLNLSFSSLLFKLIHLTTHLWSDPPPSHFSVNGSDNPPSHSSSSSSSQLVMTCSSSNTVGQWQQQLTTSNNNDPPTSSQQLAHFFGDQRT